MKIKINSLLIVAMAALTVNCYAQQPKNESVQLESPERIAEFIHWYPAIEQAKMRDQWLKKNKYGEWRFSGMVTAKDHTVVTPQADVNYGYSWFNISNQPVVITMPVYDKYYSISVFDMNHFMEVNVTPDKPVVVRLPGQKSPIADAHEIVINTYQGLAFTRQVIVNNEAEVMSLAKQITIAGGGGNFPFIIPSFTKEEEEAGLNKIKAYAMAQFSAAKVFGSEYEGVGDLDRATGVFLGQLGTQARYAQYAQYIKDQNNAALSGSNNYEITVPASGLIKDSKGYWSVTIYSTKDKYLIPNNKNTYSISSYEAKPNADGNFTIRINPGGTGDNAIPTAGVDFWGVFRVYNPVENLVFPKIEKK